MIITTKSPLAYATPPTFQKEIYMLPSLPKGMIFHDVPLSVCLQPHSLLIIIAQLHKVNLV